MRTKRSKVYFTNVFTVVDLPDQTKLVFRASTRIFKSTSTTESIPINLSTIHVILTYVITRLLDFIKSIDNKIDGVKIVEAIYWMLMEFNRVHLQTALAFLFCQEMSVSR